MNETTSSHEQQHGSHEPSTGAQQTPNGFFPWIRSLGIVRLSDDRWFAGVSAGIAKKATIDPLIIRGAFVALTVLGGPGILLYLVAWILLPDESGKIHLEERFQGRGTSTVTVAIVVLAVWILVAIFGNAFIPNLAFWNWDIWGVIGIPPWVSISFAWMFWIAVIVGVGYLVHRMILNHGRVQSRQDTATEAPDFAARATQWGNEFSEKATEWGNTVTEKANEWTAEYAEHHERVNMGTLQRLLTLAFAFLAAGGAALWAYAMNVEVSPTLAGNASAVFFAAVLAGTIVIALSMILAGIRGKQAGGIGFLGFIGVVTLVMTAILPWGTHYRLVGDHHVDSGAAGVVTVIGNSNVDLTDLNSVRSNDSFVVTHGLGNVELDLPKDRKTILNLSSFAGRIMFAESDSTRIRGGLFNYRTFTVNPDGREPALTVTVRMLGGNITVNEEGN